MYSIVEIKGKQYQVKPGEEVTVDRIEGEKETDFSDIKVLLHKNDNNEVSVGTPYLENVKVAAKVVEEIRGKKVTAVRYKPKSGYVKTRGNKQRYTKLKIESISNG